MIKKGLGRGLGAIINSSETEDNGIKEISINNIEPDVNQPRKNFNDEKLKQLSESIKQHGVVQPIIVRQENEIYKIIAGERRWRAARIAGLKTIPAIIKEYSAKQVMEIALIENLQREDLNAIEEAEAYDKLIKEHNLTQDEIANIIGKSRPAIANSLRLLNLTGKVREMIINEQITGGHARNLLTIEDGERQYKLAQEIHSKELSVRETEKLIKNALKKKKDKKVKQYDYIYADIEEKLKGIFGTKVQLLKNDKKGKIIIEYYSIDELDRILELMDGMDESKKQARE